MLHAQRSQAPAPSPGAYRQAPEGTALLPARSLSRRTVLIHLHSRPLSTSSACWHEDQAPENVCEESASRRRPALSPHPVLPDNTAQYNRIRSLQAPPVLEACSRSYRPLLRTDGSSGSPPAYRLPVGYLHRLSPQTGSRQYISHHIRHSLRLSRSRSSLPAIKSRAFFSESCLSFYLLS